MSTVTGDDLTRSPHPRLPPFVGDYVGYDISGVAAGTHLGLPSGSLTFIVAIDRPLEQYDPSTDSAEAFDVLLAGLHLRPTLIRHDGTMAGIQINFSRWRHEPSSTPRQENSSTVPMTSRPSRDRSLRSFMSGSMPRRPGRLDSTPSMMCSPGSSTKVSVLVPKSSNHGARSRSPTAACLSLSSPTTSGGADGISTHSSTPSSGSVRRTPRGCCASTEPGE